MAKIPTYDPLIDPNSTDFLVVERNGGSRTGTRRYRLKDIHGYQRSFTNADLTGGGTLLVTHNLGHHGVIVQVIRPDGYMENLAGVLWINTVLSNSFELRFNGQIDAGTWRIYVARSVPVSYTYVNEAD